MTRDLTPVLRAAWLGTEQIPVESVTKTASEVAESLKAPQVPNIVRVAFGDPPGELAAWLIETFNAEVPVVEADQPLRQQLLAVAILVSLLDEQAGPQVDQAALIVKTLTFAGREPGHSDLLTYAEKHLSWARNDTASLPSRTKTPGQSTATKEALEQLATADWAVYRTAIVELANEVTRVRQALVRQAGWVEQREAPMREQLELLWWVTSGISASAARPLNDIPALAVPVIAGLDVAALAPRVPGPPSFSGLLRFAIASASVRDDLPVSLDESRSALDGILAKPVPTPPPSDADLFPVFAHLAGNSKASIRSEAPALTLAEETLIESYLYTLIGLLESQ